MTAPLAKAPAAFGKAKKWHEKEVGPQNRRIGKRLEKAKRSDLEIFFIERVGMAGKFHARILVSEAGQGDLMPTFEKELRVGRGGSFERIGTIEPDHRIFCYDIEQWSWRFVKDERTHLVRQSRDVITAFLA